MPTARKRSTRRSPKGTPGAPMAAATKVAEPSVVHRYARVIGLPPTDALTLHSAVKRGVPYGALRQFQTAFGLNQATVRRLVQISESTLARRRARGRLESAESDRLLRMTRIFDLAVATFDGDVAEARGWLSRPQRVLGGARPEELATTEVGAQEVERALLRIEHAVFA